MKQDLSDKRKDYAENFMDYRKIPDEPFELFALWYGKACDSDLIHEPYAMTLSTVNKDGFPRGRVVLLREFSESGFVFYTNYGSQKGEEMAENPTVCLSFFWDKLEQQIIIKGHSQKVSPEISDNYFHKRPRESQLGALISEQSKSISFEFDFENEVKNLNEKWEGREIPRPKNWGGYLVKPFEFEFWQGRPSRLHDRLRYRLDNGIWRKERLAP